MQIPANNLLRLAAWGSSSRLAFWDLDEYLVLPRHQPIQQEMQAGCLQGATAWLRQLSVVRCSNVAQ
jgi:hypothetical protein